MTIRSYRVLTSACVFILFLTCITQGSESLYFGEPGGAIVVPGSILPASLNQWALECRVKALSPNTQKVLLVSQWNEPTDTGRFELSLTATGQVAIRVTADVGDIHLLTSNTFKYDGRWHHFAATWSKGTAKLYIDGKEAVSKTIPKADSLVTSELPVSIGYQKEENAKNACFEGFICDVAFWNMPFDATMLTQRASQALMGKEPGLAAYYPMTASGRPAKVVGFPRGIPEGKLSATLARVGWFETPAWDDSNPDRPWLHLHRIELSATPKPLVEGEKAVIPSINTGNRRIVANNKTHQPGVLWQDSNSKKVYVTWVESDFSQLRGAALPVLEGCDLVAGTWAEEGSLYYLMVEPLSGSRPENEISKGMIRHVAPNGQVLHEASVDMGPRGFNWYTGHGRCGMAYTSDVVSVLLPRTMYSGDPTGKSVHHQASQAATFSGDLKTVRSSGNPSSHSCGNILASTSTKDSIGLELGDCFPRSMQFHKFTKEKRITKTIFNYKAHLITIEKDGKPFKVSHDANTYTELGGVAEGEVSYSVVFATERSPDGLVLDYSRVGMPNEALNLAMLRVSKDFEKIPGGGYTINDKLMVQGLPILTPPETGEFNVFSGEHCSQRNPGLLWLTEYGPGEAARNPHIIRRGDGSILIVWEKTGGTDVPSLWGMVVHESGRKIVEPFRFGVHVAMDQGEPIVRIGNRSYMLGHDLELNKVVLCCILESTAVGLEPWAGRIGWGIENPAYSVEYRRVTTAFLRKRFHTINAISDSIDKWEKLLEFSSEKSLSAADPTLSKDIHAGISELLKDPAIRKEHEAEQKYRVIADLEQLGVKERSKSVRRENLISVATAYRDLSNAYKETRAGKKAAADFERIKAGL